DGLSKDGLGGPASGGQDGEVERADGGADPWQSHGSLPFEDEVLRWPPDGIAGGLTHGTRGWSRRCAPRRVDRRIRGPGPGGGSGKGKAGRGGKAGGAGPPGRRPPATPRGGCP